MGQNDTAINKESKSTPEIKTPSPPIDLQIYLWIFYYKRTLLPQPGTRVVIHNRPKYKASGAPHGEPGWYIGIAMEHCRCHKAYIPNKIFEQILDKV